MYKFHSLLSKKDNSIISDNSHLLLVKWDQKSIVYDDESKESGTPTKRLCIESPKDLLVKLRHSSLSDLSKMEIKINQFLSKKSLSFIVPSCSLPEIDESNRKEWKHILREVDLDHAVVSNFVPSIELFDWIHMFVKKSNPLVPFKSIEPFDVSSSRSLTRVLALSAVKGLFKQLCNIVHTLHENDVLHRDLKLEQFIVEKGTGKLFLIDFDGAVVLSPEVRTVRNNRWASQEWSARTISDPYSCPEILNRQLFLSVEDQCLLHTSDKIDWFSLGVILYILLYNIPPFWTAKIAQDCHFELFCNQKKKFWTYTSNQLAKQLGETVESTIKERVDSPIQEVINGLLHPLQEYRWSWKELSVSPWFQSISQDDVEFSSQLLSQITFDTISSN